MIQLTTEQSAALLEAVNACNEATANANRVYRQVMKQAELQALMDEAGYTRLDIARLMDLPTQRNHGSQRCRTMDAYLTRPGSINTREIPDEFLEEVRNLVNKSIKDHGGSR